MTDPEREAAGPPTDAELSAQVVQRLAALGSAKDVRLIAASITVPPPPSEADFQARKDELNDQLTLLYSDPTLTFVESQPKTSQRSFVAALSKFRAAIDDLTQREFEDIATDLRTNDEPLKSAISNLNREREKLESIAKIIATIAKVVEIVAKIAAMAA